MNTKELYELACSYLALPDMARYVICSFFGLGGFHEFSSQEERFGEKLFRKAYTENKLSELKFHVLRQKGIINAFGSSKLH